MTEPVDVEAIRKKYEDMCLHMEHHADLDALCSEIERLRESVHLHMDLSNHHNAAKCPYCNYG